MDKTYHHHSVLLPLLAWNQFAKSISLWRAAKNNDRRWYLLLAFSNTLGILDCIYLAHACRRPEQHKLLDKIYPQ
jgi:hypothetical protein